MKFNKNQTQEEFKHQDNYYFAKNDCFIQITHQKLDGSLKRKQLKANVQKPEQTMDLELIITKRIQNNDNLKHEHAKKGFPDVAFEQKSVEKRDTHSTKMIDNLSVKTADHTMFELLDNKHQCFDIGGKKHTINQELSGDEARITSIKDYQKLLYLLQKWERENEGIITEYKQDRSPTTYAGENVDQIIRQISKQETNQDFNMSKFWESVRSIDGFDNNDIKHKNLEDFSSSYKNSGNEDENPYEDEPDFDRQGPQAYLSREEIINSRKHLQVKMNKDTTQETLRKFDKENLDQFEWFIDNVFLMSDIGSIRSEKLSKKMNKNQDFQFDVVEKITEQSVENNNFIVSNKDIVSIHPKTKEILLDPKTQEIIDNMKFEEDEKLAEIHKKATMIKKLESFFLCYLCVPVKYD